MVYKPTILRNVTTGMGKFFLIDEHKLQFAGMAWANVKQTKLGFEGGVASLLTFRRIAKRLCRSLFVMLHAVVSF